MALQELSTNVINTMVRKSTSRPIWLSLSLVIGLAVFGVSTAHGQQAIEFAARVGANAFLYTSDYGHFMPNHNVGVDFSYKYRSPYYVGVRIGAGFDAAAGTFVGNPAVNANGALTMFADHYFVPRQLEANHMEVDVNYEMGKFTETQEMLIASVPVQLGLFFGDFSMFVGARAGYVIGGYYWQRMRNENMWLYYHDTGVTIGREGSGTIGADGLPTDAYPLDEITKAGMLTKNVQGINQLQRGSLPWYSITAMIDLNYSFKIGEKTDLGIGIYAEFDPLGHKPAVTTNTSLMEWHYNSSIYSETPLFYRTYSSVLEANRADGVTQRTEFDYTGEQLVKKYHRASAGIRISVSLWSIPLENGINYRKQQRYMSDCLCDLW